MTLSVFDLFTIGIGPSSSHTVGPMRAAKLFIDGLKQNADLQNVCRVQVELFGSLGATGGSHGSAKAVILGLLGQEPETVEVSKIDHELREVREKRRLILNNERTIDFDEITDLLMHRNRSLPPEWYEIQFLQQLRDCARHENFLLDWRRLRSR